METIIPQPGETWLHRHLGTVKVVRRWNDLECVCEGARPGVGTRILRDEFLQGPLSPYAYCCNGDPATCDCVNPDHGMA